MNDGESIDYNEYVSGSKLIRERDGGKYYLYVPLKIKKVDLKVKNSIISIDPGIRNFMTGISENKTMQIGNDVRDRLRIELKKLDKIKNRKKARRKKKKMQK